MPMFWCAEMAPMIPEDAALVAEDAETMIFSFSPRPDPDDDKVRIEGSAFFRSFEQTESRRIIKLRSVEKD